MASAVRTKEERHILERLVRMTGRKESDIALEALERADEILTGSHHRNADQILDDAKLVTVHLTGPYVDHATLLYDEHGLPK